MISETASIHSLRRPLLSPLTDSSTGSHSTEFFLSLIREALVVHPRGPVRIASVGCSGGQEVAVAVERWPEVAARLDVAVLGHLYSSDGPLRRSLTDQAQAAGAALRFVPLGQSPVVDPREICREMGARHLVYCDGTSLPVAGGLAALLPALHGALLPGGVLVLVNAAANEQSDGDLVSWAGSGPGTSVEVRHSPFGLHCFLAIRR